jgi:ketosteroid isomerase-like protein
MDTADERRARNRATLVEVIRRLGSEDFDGTAELMDEQFVQEWPYPPGPGASEAIHGRTPFFEFVRGMTAMEPFRYTIEAVYDLVDPGVLIAEYTSHTRVRRSGQPYSNRYAGFFRFGPDGRLVWWREYLNPELIRELDLTGPASE